MKTMTKTIAALFGAVLLCSPAWAAESAVKLADGHSWKNSTEKERVAYLVGLSEVITVGEQYDRKKVPDNSRTFMRQAYKGLNHASITQAESAVDDWYKANPDKLDKPVIVVLWITLAKPNL
jgi:hypothetical protein